jgi:hypothetical protein
MTRNLSCSESWGQAGNVIMLQKATQPRIHTDFHGYDKNHSKVYAWAVDRFEEAVRPAK